MNQTANRLARTLAIPAILHIRGPLGHTHGLLHRDAEAIAQPDEDAHIQDPDLDHNRTRGPHHIHVQGLAVGLSLSRLSVTTGDETDFEPTHLLARARARALYHTLDRRRLLPAHAIDELGQTLVLCLALHLLAAGVTALHLDDDHTVVPHRPLGTVPDRILQHLHHEPAGVNLIDSVGYLDRHMGFFGLWCSVFLLFFSY